MDVNDKLLGLMVAELAEMDVQKVANALIKQDSNFADALSMITSFTLQDNQMTVDKFLTQPNVSKETH
tara:strand:- start:2130 stop:2333 length:204 start_codon:yes stop_codon:yes gene_type:complete